MSAEEKNKALARKFFEEAWGKGNLAAVDEFIAAEYVMYPISSGLPPGPEGTKQAITTYRTAFPDLQVTVEDIFAAADRVAFRWSFRGTHLGDWLDMPPTGNHMAATGISVYRIAGGKVVENWTNISLPALSPLFTQVPRSRVLRGSQVRGSRKYARSATLSL